MFGSTHILIPIKVYLGGGWVWRSGGSGDRERRESGRIRNKVLSPGLRSTWVISTLGIEEMSKGVS